MYKAVNDPQKPQQNMIGSHYLKIPFFDFVIAVNRKVFLPS